MAPAIHTTLRVQKICKMFAAGMLPADIKQYGREEWGVTERQVERYITKARALLTQEVGGIDRQEYAAQHLSTLHFILRNSIKDRNWSCALGATAQLARLTGLEVKIQQ